MFTGIITDIGTVTAVEQRGDTRLRIACGYDLSTVDLGASIACSGVCLTVVDKGPDWFAVDVSAETQSRTAPGMWTEGRRLNLERALKVGDELGGHIVTGHVDGIGTVEAAEPIGDSTKLTIAAGAPLAPFIAAKGSIALDGVSLTINLVPHTAARTTFGDIAPGCALNIEIDILARYLGRMLDARANRV
jgi:riboflavin synthase